MTTELVFLPAGGLSPARTLITNFVLSLFSGLDMLYIYSIAPRIPPGSAHGDKTVASCFVVCVHRLCVSVSAALSSVSLYLKSIFLYQKYGNRQPVLLDVI